MSFSALKLMDKKAISPENRVKSLSNCSIFSTNSETNSKKEISISQIKTKKFRGWCLDFQISIFIFRIYRKRCEKNMLEFNEVKALDRNSEALGVPTTTLMENAGKGTAGVIIEKYIESGVIKKSPPTVVIFCGPGNNGGDGYVCARYLKVKAEVKLVLSVAPNDIKTELAVSNFNRIAPECEVFAKPEVQDVKKVLKQGDLVVDALLGAGLSGELREPYTTYLNLIEDSGLPVVSVDAPTGLGTSKALVPKFTVTFHDVKIGMTPENSGEIIIVPIGIPEEAERYIGPGELAAYYPLPSKKSHKGQNGRLLIVGGGPYTGAPALAGLAALRTGVDLVHIATPAKSEPIIAGFTPNFIVHGLGKPGGDHIVPGDVEKIIDLAKQCDAVVLGPGTGRHPDTYRAVLDILKECSIPVVLDADGLSAVSRDFLNEYDRSKLKWLVTPHYNEFLRLSDAAFEDRKKNDDASSKSLIGTELESRCSELSNKLCAVIVLKGKEDIVCDRDNLKINRTGNPGMTVGGTGDVLAGIIGALAAKKVDLYNSGRMGVFISGYAGDLCWKELGTGLTATDIINKIPRVLTEFISF
jgi:NAD(P)H-hydrate epimerase